MRLDSRMLKILSITDEYTRESVVLEVGRSFSGAEVVAVLKRVSIERDYPGHIRSDNGGEFISTAVKRWVDAVGGEVMYVAGGSPCRMVMRSS